MKNDKKAKSKKNVTTDKKVTNNNVERKEEIREHDVDFERVDEDASFKLL